MFLIFCHLRHSYLSLKLIVFYKLIRLIACHLVSFMSIAISCSSHHRSIVTMRIYPAIMEQQCPLLEQRHMEGNALWVLSFVLHFHYSGRVSLVMPDPFVFQHRGHESPVSSALSQTTEPIQLYCSKAYVFIFIFFLWNGTWSRLTLK